MGCKPSKQEQTPVQIKQPSKSDPTVSMQVEIAEKAPSNDITNSKINEVLQEVQQPNLVEHTPEQFQELQPLESSETHREKPVEQPVDNSHRNLPPISNATKFQVPDIDFNQRPSFPNIDQEDVEDLEDLDNIPVNPVSIPSDNEKVVKETTNFIQIEYQNQETPDPEITKSDQIQVMNIIKEEQADFGEVKNTFEDSDADDIAILEQPAHYQPPDSARSDYKYKRVHLKEQQVNIVEEDLQSENLEYEFVEKESKIQFNAAGAADFNFDILDMTPKSNYQADNKLLEMSDLLVELEESNME